VFKRLIAQHVSGDTPPVIRSSKNVIAASGFTYVFVCRPLRWLSGNCIMLWAGRMYWTGGRPSSNYTVCPIVNEEFGGL